MGGLDRAPKQARRDGGGAGAPPLCKRSLMILTAALQQGVQHALAQVLYGIRAPAMLTAGC